MDLARASSGALDAEESTGSVAESSSRAPPQALRPVPEEQTSPLKRSAPSAAKMPPVPSRAAAAAAQAQGQAALQPAKAARMPPVPSRAQVASAQVRCGVAAAMACR
jgi:nuclear pore complex protein Nup214